jgi:opacity protein-like surface antigen
MKIKAILLGAVSAITLATSMQASAWFENESYFVECYDDATNKPLFFQMVYSRAQVNSLISRCSSLGGSASVERVR